MCAAFLASIDTMRDKILAVCHSHVAVRYMTQRTGRVWGVGDANESDGEDSRR